MDEILLLRLILHHSMSPRAPSTDALSRRPAVSMVDQKTTSAYHVDYVTSKRGWNRRA